MNVFQQTAERFECVTIFFGDIVGFNLMTADCNAIEVKTRLVVGRDKLGIRIMECI